MKHAEINLEFLKANREAIIVEINECLEMHPYNKFNVSLKDTINVLLNEITSYSADYSLDNLGNLVNDAIVTAKDNRVVTMHPEDFARAQARRQAINL